VAAHLRQLPSCQVCGKPAVEELFNTWNATLGVFCGRHAGRALAEKQKEDGGG